MISGSNDYSSIVIYYTCFRREIKRTKRIEPMISMFDEIRAYCSKRFVAKIDASSKKKKKKKITNDNYA